MTIDYDAAYRIGGPVDLIRIELEPYAERFHLAKMLIESLILSDDARGIECGLVSFVVEACDQIADGFLDDYYRKEMNAHPKSLRHERPQYEHAVGDVVSGADRAGCGFIGRIVRVGGGGLTEIMLDDVLHDTEAALVRLAFVHSRASLELVERCADPSMVIDMGSNGKRWAWERDRG